MNTYLYPKKSILFSFDNSEKNVKVPSVSQNRSSQLLYIYIYENTFILLHYKYLFKRLSNQIFVVFL